MDKSLQLLACMVGRLWEFETCCPKSIFSWLLDYMCNFNSENREFIRHLTYLEQIAYDEVERKKQKGKLLIFSSDNRRSGAESIYASRSSSEFPIT